MQLAQKYLDLKNQLDRAITQEEIQEVYDEIEQLVVETSVPQLEWTVEGNNLISLQYEAKEKLDAEQE